jgi:hypothetical protein
LRGRGCIEGTAPRCAYQLCVHRQHTTACTVQTGRARCRLVTGRPLPMPMPAQVVTPSISEGVCVISQDGKWRVTKRNRSFHLPSACTAPRHASKCGKLKAYLFGGEPLPPELVGVVQNAVRRVYQYTSPTALPRSPVPTALRLSAPAALCACSFSSRRACTAGVLLL